MPSEQSHPQFHADLHIHSKYSRACSRDCDLEHLTWYAKRKGLTLVGTGDFTHPAWNAHLRETLVPAEPGLYRLNDELAKSVDRTLPGIVAASTVRFMLSVEISTIYKRGDKTRKVHHLVYLPDLDAVDRFNAKLGRIGNIASDGRPILGLDSRDLLEITLEASPDGYLVPAHIWTPWFAALGSKSGFDAIADCYVDLADQIFAVETGLSSDPAMNWRVSSLDKYTLVSNSDAHSPPALAREAHSYTTALDYYAVREALRTGEGYAGSIEFFPEEGKYHADGHRTCGVRWQPDETQAHDGLCEHCGKPVTVGVLSRIEALADRPDGVRPGGKAGFQNLVPLPEIVGEILDVGPRSKTVTREVDGLVAALGPELDILTTIPPAEVAAVGGELLGEAVARLRRGEVIRQPGFDGEYGVIRLFEPSELRGQSGTAALFDLPEQPSLYDVPSLAVSGKAIPAGSASPPGAAAIAARKAGAATPSAKRRTATAGRRADQTALDAHAAGNAPGDHSGDPAAAAGLGRTATKERPVTGPGRQRGPVTPAREKQDATGPAKHGGASYGGSPAAGGGGGADSEHAGVRNELLPLVLPSLGVLEGLDPEQRAAAGAPDGPMIVVAGPGTGKTRTLTHRIAYLVAERDVDAASCLAITFTRRAAAELAERLSALLSTGETTDASAQSVLSTGETTNASARSVLSTGETTDASARSVIPAGAGRPMVATFHALALAVCREQFALLGFEAPPRVADDADKAAVLLELDADPAKPVPDELREGYRKRLRARGLLELDELVPLAADLVAEPALEAVYRARWPHVLVDEYQDVDAEQYRLLRALVPQEGSLFAIGDPDQSIYSFRGADVGFFLRFAEDYPTAKTVTLTRNYRSAPPIVATAVQVVRPSTLVPGRALSAERRDLGAARVAVHRTATESEEAGWVAATIDALVGGASFHSLDSGRVDGTDEGESVPVGFSDIAVLYRTDAQSRALLSAFASAGLPSEKRGVDRLADRPGVPALLRELSRHGSGTLVERLRSAAGVLAGRSSTPDLFGELSGLPEPKAGEVWGAVELLRPLAESHGHDVEGFLTAVATGAEVDAHDPRGDAVSLLTLHASKGLEFPVVFIVGCADGVIPMRWPGGTADEQAARAAEELRLFFVGLTRARRRLFLSAPRAITRRGAVSEALVTPFLAPVDEGLLDKTGAEEPRRPAVRQMRLI